MSGEVTEPALVSPVPGPAPTYGVSGPFGSTPGTCGGSMSGCSGGDGSGTPGPSGAGSGGSIGVSGMDGPSGGPGSGAEGGTGSVISSVGIGMQMRYPRSCPANAPSGLCTRDAG